MNKRLLLILLFALIIRLVSIDSPTLFGDEIDVGNQAYSILTTLRDYRGNFLPTYFQSFSESRAPLYLYSALPSIALFGRSEIGVRLPSVIFGLLSIYFLYLLTLHFSKSISTSLATSLILSITPWHLHYSRAGFEVTLLLTLLLSASYFFLKNKHYLSIILFSLSFYTYNTANIFTPLILGYLFFTTPDKGKLIRPFFVFATILLPLLFQIFFGQAGNRFSLISIFNNSGIIDKIVEQRTSFSAASPNVERIFHNKATGYLFEFSKNYLTALSPQFLFLAGDPNPRHQVPSFGPLLLLLCPLFVLGFIKNYQKYPFFTFWLLASPLASSLTINGGYHATRLFIMLPALIFFAALVTKKIIFALLFINLFFYLHQYFVHFPKDNFENWNYGQKYLYSTPVPIDSSIYVSNTNFDSLSPFIFYQNIPPRFTQLPNFSDSQPNFDLTPNIKFISQWQNPDTLSAVNQMATSGDIFFLLQLKDIPGDWDLSKSPLPGFTTLNTVYLPNHLIYGQVIQKI